MDLYDLTVTEALNGLNNKKFTSQELVQSCLRRIEQVENKINAFITITAELALKQAADADRLRAKGKKLPLLGIPVGIKDIFCTQGIETTAASNILRGFIPPYDATVVKRLKAAGAVILGKLNQDAFAHGASGENSDFGATLNPWDLERVPGGSSSGSAAAVAAGECLFALATDTAGSVRLPASFCNLTGLKNTYGRVSRYGVIAMGSSLDCPGALTKTVEDLARVTGVIAGQDALDSTSLPAEVPDYSELLSKRLPQKLTIGYPREFFVEGLDHEIAIAIEKARLVYEDLGIRFKSISLPHSRYGVAIYYVLCLSEISSNLARYDGIRYWASQRYGKSLTDIYFDTRGECFGDEAKRRIMLGTFALSSGYYDDYYEKARKIRTLVKKDFEQAFEEVDLIIAPTSPTLPFKLGEKAADPLQMYLCDVFTAPINLAGVPSLALPCGFSGNLPIGMQLIGPQLSEKLLFQIGHAYQQVTDWHKRKPSVELSTKNA